jgi:hypothetical protein
MEHCYTQLLWCLEFWDGFKIFVNFVHPWVNIYVYTHTHIYTYRYMLYVPALYTYMLLGENSVSTLLHSQWCLLLYCMVHLVPTILSRLYNVPWLCLLYCMYSRLYRLFSIFYKLHTRFCNIVALVLVFNLGSIIVSVSATYFLTATY